MMKYYVINYFLILFTASMISSCSHMSPYTLPTEIDDELSQSPPTFTASSKLPDRYLLQNYDELTIKFFYNSDLNEEIIIRPDGYISLQLIGDIKAAGKKPEELRQALIDSYTGLLNDPEISVLVKKFVPPKVYIGGMVRNPGAIILDTDLTVTKAIIQSGGFRYGAKNTDIVILRDNGTQNPSFYKINFKDHITHKSVQDFLLSPSDIVFVPQTEVNSAAQFFAENISNILPIYRNMSINYDFVDPR